MIKIVGARENNLKNVSIELPENKLIVFSGVSGSGKSSLAFDTIGRESARLLGETFPTYVRARMPHYKRPDADLIDGLTPAVIIDQKPFAAGVRSTVGTLTEAAPYLRLLFSRCSENSAGPSSAYSFNDPLGFCPDCGGLGEKVQLDLDKLLDKELSINEGAIRFSQFAVGSWQWQLYARNGLYDPDKKLKDFTEQEWKLFLYGTDEKFTVKLANKLAKDGTSNLKYDGLADRFNRLWLGRDIEKLNKKTRAEVEGLIHTGPCPTCKGARLNQKALASTVNDKSIFDLGQMPVVKLTAFLQEFDHPLAQTIKPPLLGLLRQIEAVGLGYLHLNRPAASLSGGELQRLKLVRYLGSSLRGLTYILDEPTTGLHPHDVHRLIGILKALRDKGNTVLVVEHDRQVIQAADLVVDMGPGAGDHGGEVLFFGGTDQLAQQQNSLTAAAMKQDLQLNKNPRKQTGSIKITNAKTHNLKGFDVEIPLGVLCGISGVAGSGKSSLMKHEIKKAYPQAVVVDQSPIGTSSRSTPATYVGVMDEVRSLFAKANKVSASLFSFNSKGACPVCGGKGENTPDMAFADPVTIVCERCGGSRYSDEALSYTYMGKTIVDVQNMSVDEAVHFFKQPKISEKLQLLQQVGLGYIKLGQPCSTLSGGECQRLKLTDGLLKTGSVFLLDEPTTGLHPCDVQVLLGTLNRLIDAGNSIILSEHNVDVLCACDYLIDLGPGAGDEGGQLLYSGTPEGLKNCESSITAKYLL